MTNDPQREMEHLFRQYGKGVGSYVLSRVRDPELAEEITARVFLTVVRRYHQVRGSAAAWLWAVVRSELARHFRDRSRFVQPEDELPAPDDEPADALVRRETLAKLGLALEQLSEEQRQLIDMKFFLNMRNCDIAEVTGLTPANVGVIVYRTLKQLRGLMDDSKPFSHEPKASAQPQSQRTTGAKI